MPLGVDQQFAGYTVVRRLGAGGMGEVYLAQHPRLPRRDALKLLTADVSVDPIFRERFLQEADGYLATLVSGEVIAENGRLSGVRPGRLVRAGRLAA